MQSPRVVRLGQTRAASARHLAHSRTVIPGAKLRLPQYVGDEARLRVATSPESAPGSRLGEHGEQSGLASAIRPDEVNPVAVRNGKADVLK